MSEKSLLWFIEFGGYPDFSPLYRSLGYDVTVVTSGRKAQSCITTRRPDVIVAEFNFQPDFRDRTSSLESLLATAQQLPGTRVVVFYAPEQSAHLERLRQRFPGFVALPYPVEEERLKDFVGAP